MKKIVQSVKLVKDILLGKECYFPIQLKKNIIWYGKPGAGFYVCAVTSTEHCIFFWCW